MLKIIKIDHNNKKTYLSCDGQKGKQLPNNGSLIHFKMLMNARMELIIVTVKLRVKILLDRLTVHVTKVIHGMEQPV